MQEVESRSGRLELDVAKRQIDASLQPDKRVYQVMVIAVGPECKDLQVGDLAILPPRKGTMITVVDEKTNEPLRVYAIRESDVLALYRMEDAS